MEGREMKYKIAFSFLKRMSGSLLKEFSNRGITPEEFFTLPTAELVKRLGIRHDHEFDKMAREEAVMRAGKELERISQHNIEPLFLLDEKYPSRLYETYEPPIILYKLGDGKLESEHSISVVGTRKPTPYGCNLCLKIVGELGDYFPDALIVSGLAFGIDAIAHKKALEQGIETIAVVAHGLNMIYPAANRGLAKEIIKQGGAILSEYPFDTQPFRPNFLARNRIVAGLSEATLVIESNIKGGAMSTANYAFNFNRDLMALPGRASDSLSSGCNLLIRKNKAHLVECGADIIEVTGWMPLNVAVNPRQRNLFPELSGDARKIVETLKYESEAIHLDALGNKLDLSPSQLLPIIGELEFDGIIIKYPGNRIALA